MIRYNLDANNDDRLIQVRITGPCTFDDYQQLAAEVMISLSEKGWDRVLLDDTEVQHISTTANVQLFPAMLETIKFPHKGRFAIVTGSDRETASDAELFAEVCTEAGFRVRHFQRIDDAHHWLTTPA